MTLRLLVASWRQLAACRGRDTDAFYVSKDVLHPPDEIREVCESCPVRADCLFEALVHREQGVWGGTTERQRKLLLRRYRRASCPSCAGVNVPMLEGRQVCLACGLSWLALKIRTAGGVRTLEVVHPSGVESAHT
jgi:WhiB family redox-sensing transcriptional regulator